MSPRRKRTLFVCSLILICLTCCVTLPCIQTVRDGEGWVRSNYNVTEIGRGITSYCDVHGHLPPAVVRDELGQPLYSCRFRLLHYVHQDRLQKQVHLREPWDSPH